MNKISLLLSPSIFNWVVPILFLSAFSYHFALAGHSQNRMFTLAGGQKSVHLPFVSVDNLIVVKGRLNGDIPLNLILDTGAPSNLLIDPRISRQLNQDNAKEISFSGTGSGQGPIQGRIMIGLSLEIGEIRGHDIAMVATSTKPELFKRVTTLPVHGVLGYPFFHQFVITVDYANHLLTISEPKYFIPAFDAQALHFSLVNSKPVLCNSLTIGKHIFPGRLLIDTGASHELLLNKSLGAKTKDLCLRKTQEKLGSGFGGDIYGTKGMLPHLQLGTQEFRNVHVLLPDKGQYAKLISLDQDGAIGNGLLKDFVVTIDYFRKTMYLQKPGAVLQVAFQTGKEIKRQATTDRQREEVAIP